MPTMSREYMRAYRLRNLEKLRARDREWMRRKYGHKPRVEVPAEVRQRMRELIDAGHTNREIAKMTGWAPSTVSLVKLGGHAYQRRRRGEWVPPRPIKCSPRRDTACESGTAKPRRKFDCAHYDNALRVACARDWDGFRCPRSCRAYEVRPLTIDELANNRIEVD